MPSIARPPERTSSVVTIFARRPGSAVAHACNEKTQRHPLGASGDVAERRVPLEHRVLRARELLHLEVVVHAREHRAAGVLRRLRRVAHMRGERARASRQRLVEEMDADFHRTKRTGGSTPICPPGVPSAQKARGTLPLPPRQVRGRWPRQVRGPDNAGSFKVAGDRRAAPFVLDGLALARGCVCRRRFVDGRERGRLGVLVVVTAVGDGVLELAHSLSK